MAEYETIRRAGVGVRTSEIDVGLRAHMNKVYGLMSTGMVITGLIAYFIGTNEAAVMALFDGPSRFVVMLAPLAYVYLFGAMVNRIPETTAHLMFYGFSALMGMSISYIFAYFNLPSIAQTFFVTAIAFAGLSLWGYTTKRDISGWRSFLIMGVIGLIVASIVNIWLGSPAITFAVSVLGVLIFAGLTAYDTQNIKNTYIAMASHGQTEWLGKSAIMGALSLYLNFLNMFMFLLQFMGSSE